MRVEEIAKLIYTITDTFYPIGFKILAAKTCENDFLNKLIWLFYNKIRNYLLMYFDVYYEQWMNSNLKRKT